MADYKELINGTISTIIDKAKDVAASGTVQDLYAKAKDSVTGGTVREMYDKAKDTVTSSGVKDIYESGMNRAKSLGQMAKTAISVNGDSEELKKVYAEIGKLFYEQSKNAPDSYYAPLFEQVERLTASIAEKEETVRSFRSGFSGSGTMDADICEFEDIVSADEEKNR